MKKGFKIKNIAINSRLTLAPMAGITDSPYRRICVEFGVGYVTTELVSCKGLIYNNIRTDQMLVKSYDENILAIQLFGGDPNDFALCLRDKRLEKFDIIDINMGCPAKKITGNNEGSSLMKDPLRASKIIKACVDSTSKPVTVKFRLGYEINEFSAVEFAKMCMDNGASAITVHGRYAKQMYSGQADWDKIGKIASCVGIPVIGNGDVTSVQQAYQNITTYGVKAVAIGRAAIGNPMIFIDNYNVNDIQKPTSKKSYAKKHLQYMQELYGDRASILFRSHMSYYLKGIKEGKNIKEQAMRITNVEDMLTLINSIEF